MPVSTTSLIHFSPGTGQPPGAPTQVTSITKDAAATVSFLPPAFTGDGPVTSYTITPYIGGSPQAPATIPAASTTAITASNGSTYRQAPVTGLANGTAYTFTVKAANSAGAGPESAASAANTPYAGLVFGDDFNGPAAGPVDPEWWVYTRCGYLLQNELEYWLPSQCVLDGAGHLKLTATKQSYTGPTYPSDGNRTVTQSWKSGACQSNVKAWAPAAGNTMTFEVSWRNCPDAGNGPWPAPWLEGQAYLDAWKTDPYQGGWDSTTHAEVDIAEWPTGSPTGYFETNVYAGSNYNGQVNTGIDLSAAFHSYKYAWKPGVSSKFYFDGSLMNSTAVAPASGAQLFLLLYLQISNTGGATADNSCYVDFVRIYDQNLG